MNDRLTWLKDHAEACRRSSCRLAQDIVADIRCILVDDSGLHRLSSTRPPLCCFTGSICTSQVTFRVLLWIHVRPDLAASDGDGLFLAMGWSTGGSKVSPNLSELPLCSWTSAESTVLGQLLQKHCRQLRSDYFVLTYPLRQNDYTSLIHLYKSPEQVTYISQHSRIGLN